MSKPEIEIIRRLLIRDEELNSKAFLTPPERAALQAALHDAETKLARQPSTLFTTYPD